MKKLIAIIALLSLTVGCASTGMGSKDKNIAYGEYVKSENIESIDKIRAFRFSGWQSLTNHFLILSSSRNKYLIELNQYCQELMFTDAIIVDKGGNSSLNVRFNSISTVDRKYAKCFIKSIYPVTKEQSKVVLAIGSGSSEE